MKAIVFDNYKLMFEKINKYLNIAKIEFELIRFKNGDSKVLIKEDITNEDIIIFSDFSNHIHYDYLGEKRIYSSDEYYVELKRLISALDGVHSISAFLPLIYQSRQNSNNNLESKDYLMFINDLKMMGVENIITFESHGDDNSIYNFSLAELFSNCKYDVVVSPDKGGIKRASNYSNVINCDLSNFDKVRDLEKLSDGSNPIKEYISSCYDFTNKDVLIVDDILDSGSTIIKAIENIKNAKIVDIFIAYPLFSKGIDEFKELYSLGNIRKIYVSNLIHVDDKLLKEEFIEVKNVERLISEAIKEVIK